MNIISVLVKVVLELADKKYILVKKKKKHSDNVALILTVGLIILSNIQYANYSKTILSIKSMAHFDLLVNLNVCCYNCNFNMTSRLKINMIILNLSVLMVVLLLTHS